ncbi:MAG: hypothetical protein J6Q17_08280, partial [Clostridia bacterium]|nr:hypothetical protein [Clostridia bacterium]
MAKLNDKNERPTAADGSWSIDLNFDEPAAPEAPAEKKPAEPVTDDVFAFDIPEDIPAAPDKAPEPPKKPEPPVSETQKVSAPEKKPEPAAPEKKPEPTEKEDDALAIDELLASFAPVKAAAEESGKIEAGAQSSADDVLAEISAAEPVVDLSAEEVSDTESATEAAPEEKGDVHPAKEKTALFAGMTSRRKAREAAVVKPREKKAVDESSRKYLVRTVAVLTGICAGVALLLAVIHGATQSVIAENVEREKNEAILAVFPEGNDIREYVNEDGEKVYIVLRDGTIVGYCVNAVGSGYIGDISMMV